MSHVEAMDKDTRITITVPASLRRMLRESAARNDRTFSGEIVRCLKKGSGWDEVAAGGSFGDQAPAAGNENAAFERGEV